MRKSWFGCAAIVAAVVLPGFHARAAIYRVKASAAAGGDGATWGTAYNRLQDALAVAGPGDQVWVAAANYTPGTMRTSSFVLNGEQVLGGFPAAGGTLATRNPAVNITTLSGKVSILFRAYHVVTAHSGSMDGFTITGGNANDVLSTINSYGGGVYVDGSVSVSACKIIDNDAAAGGGMYFFTNDPGETLTLRDCVIIDNYAKGTPTITFPWHGAGGGLLTNSQEDLGRVNIDRCSFLGNTAETWGGGMVSEMFNQIYDTVFSGNEAPYAGGLSQHTASVEIFECKSSIINCTFAGNLADGTGGASLSRCYLFNSILWGNTAVMGPLLDWQLTVDPANTIVAYCDTEGGVLAGTANISADPLYVLAAGSDTAAGTLDDNLRLKAGSPCRDAGDNAVVTAAGIMLDRDKTNRIRVSKPLGGSLTVDIGAYEHSAVVVAPPPDVAPVGPARVR